MRIATLALAALLMAGCNKADTTADSNMANDAMANDAMATNAAANAAIPAALATINTSTWEFTDPKSGKAMQESVDAAGKYITVAGTEHIDHGTAMMKDGKACFTSAMTKDGELCWTDPKIAIGESGETVSDKGEKLTIKRTAYVPLTM